MWRVMRVFIEQACAVVPQIKQRGERRGGFYHGIQVGIVRDVHNIDVQYSSAVHDLELLVDGRGDVDGVRFQVGVI